MTDENIEARFPSPPDVKEGAEPDKKNPWGDDDLRRKKYAKPLTDLVNSARNAPFCIAVDGEWGSGKTFFLKQWGAEFSEQGKVIYFNAWEDDFQADPLTAIIGQLWGAIEGDGWEEICNLWKEKCKTIIKRKALKYVGLDENDLQIPSEKAVKEYLNARQNISTLKERLKNLADAAQEKTGSPLVVVVDELDRCRPTFAIELLERVKHVVGVPGVVFVFGVNLKELEKSIKLVYGDIASEDYLRRVFHPPFLALPQADASKYCQYLIEKREIIDKIEKSPFYKENFKESDWGSAMRAMLSMAGYMELSLRQTEQSVSMLQFVLNSKKITDKQGVYGFEEYLVILILLRIKDRDLYEKFFDEKYTVQDAINTTMDAMFDFLPWEKVRGGMYSEVKNCIVIIMLVFYSFYDEEKYRNIYMELQTVCEDLYYSEELTKQYDYVPSKIVKIQDNNAQYYIAKELRALMGRLIHNHQSSYYSREEIARLLEWGDYWQE